MRKSLFALAAAATLTAGVAHAAPATYAIDPAHTFVTFEISHFGASVNRGRFDKKEGSVQFDRAGKAGKVEISFDATSVNTGTAPQSRMASQVATKVNPWVITSSPAPTPSAARATLSAAVPELTAWA